MQIPAETSFLLLASLRAAVDPVARAVSVAGPLAAVQARAPGRPLVLDGAYDVADAQPADRHVRADAPVAVVRERRCLAAAHARPHRRIAELERGRPGHTSSFRSLRKTHNVAGAQQRLVRSGTAASPVDSHSDWCSSSTPRQHRPLRVHRTRSEMSVTAQKFPNRGKLVQF